MKLKRFVALVVSLAMVLSIVPAFSLTASAAEYTLFDVATDLSGISGEQPINVAGWTANETNGAVRWNQNWGPEATGIWGNATGTYALMFFYTQERSGDNNKDAYVTAAIDKAEETFAATKISIDFNFAMQDAPANLYQTWTFKDLDGKDFARLYFDKNAGNGNGANVGVNTHTTFKTTVDEVLAMRGQHFNITAEKNTSGTYTVTYTVAGAVVATEDIANINGFSAIQAHIDSWNNIHSAAGMQDLKISYEIPDNIHVVNATYNFSNGEVYKIRDIYDTNTGATSLEIPEFYYSPNGTNEMYLVPAQSLTESAVIEVTDENKCVNGLDKNTDEFFVPHNGKIYKYATGANIIPNGDFAYGLEGWYNGLGNAATSDHFNVNGNALTAVGATADAGSTTALGLYRAWDITPGTTYAFTFNVNKDVEWGTVREQNSTAMATDIVASYIENNYGMKADTNQIVFTATGEYLVFSAGWFDNHVFSNFGLYELEETEAGGSYSYITIDYTVDGEVVHSEKIVYNSEDETGSEYEYYYSPNGSNFMYRAQGYATEDTVAPMEVVINASEKAPGETFVEGEGVYEYLTGENLVPNGTFTLDLKGWYNGLGNAATADKFQVNKGGNITILVNEGHNTAGGLYRAWATEIGKTYVLTFNASVASDQFHVVSAKNDLSTVDDGDVIRKYSEAGNNFVVFTAKHEYVQINFRWSQENSFGNFGLYEVKQTGRAATVTYKADGAEVNKVTKEFGLTEFGVDFDEYYYSANGSSDMYVAEAMTEVAHDTTVEMTKVDNWTAKVTGESVTYNEAEYVVVSENLVPNGNFENGLTGWYNGTGAAATTGKFALNGDGTVKVLGDGGSSSDSAFQRSWAIEPGKTYLFTYTQDNANVGSSGSARWQRLSIGNDFANNNEAMLLGAGNNDVETGQEVVWGTNTVVFTNTDGYAYANFRAGYSVNVSMGNFGLYEVLGTENSASVTYTLNGDVVHTAEATYNTAEHPEGYPFDHYHYSENGTNVMYYADEVTTHGDVTVELIEHENWAGYDIGDYVMYALDGAEESPYQVVSGNLIPNGNFEHKLTGWYNGVGTEAGDWAFTVNGDGTVTATWHGDYNTDRSLYRAWDVEIGKTYLLTYTSNYANSYHKVFATDAPAVANTGTQLNSGSVVGENTVVFEATAEYVQIDFYWLGEGRDNTLGNFGLYEVTPSNVITVNYRFDTTPNDGDPNDGDLVYTVSKSFVGEESVWIDEFYYSPIDSSVMYMLPGQNISMADDSNGDGIINLDIYQVHAPTGAVTTRVANWSHEGFDATDLYTASTDALNDVAYLIASRNLVPNGNFGHGLATWYNGLGEMATTEYFKVNEGEGTVTFLTDLASNTKGGIYEVWKVTPGEKYVAMCYASRDCETGTLHLTNDPDVDLDGETIELLGSLKAGENVVEFTVPEGMEYLQLNIGNYLDGEFGNFGIYRLETLIPFGENYPLKKTIIDGNAPVLPEYVVVDGDDTLRRVAWDAAALNALVYGDNTVTGVMDNGETIEAVVEVYPRTDEREDQDSYNGQADLTANGGNKRLAQPITGKFAIEMDVTVHENGDLWIILNDSEKTGDTSFFGKDSVLFGFYFDGEFYAQDGHGDGTREEMETLMVTAIDKTYRVFVRGDCETDKFSVTVTSPEGTSRTFEDLGFRTNVGKLDSIAMLTNSDGLGSFTATNIKIYDPENLQVRYVLDENNDTEVSEGDKELGISDIGDYFYGETINLVGEERFYISYNDAETGKDMGHIVQSLEEYTIEVTPENSIAAHAEEVLVKMIKEHAVVYDTFATANEGEWINPNNLLFVGSNGVADAKDVDDDGEATKSAATGDNVGAPRVPLLTFNITDSLKEEAENKAVRLNLYVAQTNQNLGDNQSMRLAVAEVSDLVVDEGTMYVPADVADTTKLIWSDQEVAQTAENDGSGRHTVNTRIGIDVTEMVRQAIADGKETITFALYAPVAGAYVVNREEAVLDARYQQHAAYLEAEDAYTITVQGASKITKNGSAVQLDESGATTVVIPDKGAVARLYTENASDVVFVENSTTKIHNIATETTSENTSVRRATVTAATMVDGGVYYPVKLGADMVDGAQVRIGGGVDENGEFVGGSGLRFITVVNQTDTLAAIALNAETMEIGVKVTADGSSQAVYIPAAKWQTEGEVFTSALTNLEVSNYNRNFTAVPYIKCTDADGIVQEYTNAPVTRSIYKVAAGLLAKGYGTDDEFGVETDGKYKDADGEETIYDGMPENLVNVLNTYVNKVGVRLTLSDSSELTARLTGNGAYTGEAFFTVSGTTYADGKYTVTLTAVGQSKIDVDLFNKYVRINNNNSKVGGFTEITDNGDGTYTIVFDYGTMQSTPEVPSETPSEEATETPVE